MPSATAMAFSIAALLSGALVGFILGLVGGGGSILATPLLLYVVGVSSPHLAIGTGALAVAVSAALNLANYGSRHWVRWRPALIFSLVGAIGAFAGSSLGKLVDGTHLLVLFGGVMFVVGLLMLKRPVAAQPADAPAGWLLPMLALLAGAASGFFGIGGGFLIVPALLVSTRMPLLEAIGTSLVAVTAFGLATSLNYALSGYVDWPVALQFILGGLAGGLGGTALAGRLAPHRRVLNTTLAVIILSAATYVSVEGIGALLGPAA